MLQLKAVKVTHDASAATVDALNIRRNASTILTVTEWQRGVSSLPEAPRATYSIADTSRLTLAMEAIVGSTGGRRSLCTRLSHRADGR